MRTLVSLEEPMAESRNEGLAAAIRRFREAAETTPGEWPDQVDAVTALEDYLPAEEALEFLLHVLRDPTAYDLARIEVCKVLRVFVARSEEQASACVDALLGALHDEDVLIRQWAAMGLVRLGAVGSAPSTLAAVVVDGNEDLSVRHSAVEALRVAGFPGSSRATVAKVVDDELLSSSIRRALSQ
jgi:HEAT repeat protein